MIRAFSVLLAVLLLQGAHADKQVCVVPAKVQATSNVAVGGTITKPVAATVLPNSLAPFTGLVNVVFPQEKCPTAATLPQALSKAYLATPKNWQGLNMGPTTAKVVIGNTQVASVAVNDLAGALLSKPGPMGIATPIVTASSGMVTTKSEITKISPVNLAGQTLSISGGACSLTPAGSKITFECPQLKVNNNLNMQQGSGVLSIKGKLAAVGDLTGAKLVPAGDVPKAPQ